MQRRLRPPPAHEPNTRKQPVVQTRCLQQVHPRNENQDRIGLRDFGTPKLWRTFIGAYFKVSAYIINTFQIKIKKRAPFYSSCFGEARPIGRTSLELR